jgi:hypothetical protein
MECENSTRYCHQLNVTTAISYGNLLRVFVGGPILWRANLPETSFAISFGFGQRTIRTLLLGIDTEAHFAINFGFGQRTI